MEFENDAKQGHQIHPILHGLWLRGRAPHRPRIRVTSTQSVQRAIEQGDSRERGRLARGGSRHGPPQLYQIPVETSMLPRQTRTQKGLKRGRPCPAATAKQSRTPQADPAMGRPVRGRRGLETRNVQVSAREGGGLHQRMEHRTATSILPLEVQNLCSYVHFVLRLCKRMHE